MDPFDVVFLALFPLVMTWIGFAVWASFDMDRAGRHGTSSLALIMVLPPIGFALWWKQRGRPGPVPGLRSRTTLGGTTTRPLPAALNTANANCRVVTSQRTLRATPRGTNDRRF
jgi:hypothetical protein